VTGQVAGGANIVCFTTGRGSCFGCKPAPSLKLATNTPMYQRMSDDMDIIAARSSTARQRSRRSVSAFPDDPGHRLGKHSKSEEFGYGEDEFRAWHFGATM